MLIYHAEDYALDIYSANKCKCKCALKKSIAEFVFVSFSAFIQ